MRNIVIFQALSMVFLAAAAPLQAVESYGDYPADKLEIELWLDQATGSVYEPGNKVNIFFSTNHDSYVVVYDVDTQGFINVLYPKGDDSSWVEAERIVGIPGPRDQYDLIVEGPKGIEYVVAVASPTPMDVGSLYAEDDRDEGYRYAGRIAGDANEAIYELNNGLAWGSDDYDPEGYASDIGWFYVEHEVPWPRYLVYTWYPDRFWDPYWDPYVDADIFIDYSWDQRWCRPCWWCGGCEPIYSYWYIAHDGGPRVRWKHWKHHDSWHPEWRRVKAPRRVRRSGKMRAESTRVHSARRKESRSRWHDAKPDRESVRRSDRHVREKAPRSVDRSVRIHKHGSGRHSGSVEKKKPRKHDTQSSDKPHRIEKKEKRTSKKPAKKSDADDSSHGRKNKHPRKR